MRFFALLSLLVAAPIWADRAPDAPDDIGRGRRCGSAGSSCSSHPCCAGFTCSLGMCEKVDKDDALNNPEAARKKARAEHRDEPSGNE